MLTLSGCGQGEALEPLGANQFVSTWRTANTSTGSSTSTQVTLPLISTGTYNFVVQWGDGTSNTITTWNQAETTHTYSKSGTYQIKITSTCYGWCFNNSGDRLKLLSVEKWGNSFRTANDYGSFFGCSNLELQQVDDVLDLTGTTKLDTFFYQCEKLTKVRNINQWNLVNITSLNRMFERAILFDDNVGAWNTSNVTDMQNVFAVAVSFNNGGSPTINNWDTSKNTTLRFMFASDSFVGTRTHKFNQPIGDWNTSLVNTTFGMFSRNSEFNQPVNTKAVTKLGVTYTAWDMQNVTDMSFMFSSGVSDTLGKFNQDISNWNTSKVTTMRSMFGSQPLFNQNIGTKVSTVNGVTYTAWDTLNVTDMSFMLSAQAGGFSVAGAFTNLGSNSIRNWNTSKVTTMQSMFNGQQSFNENVGTKAVTVNGVTYTAWDTLNVTNMSFMFSAFASTNTSAGIFTNGGSASFGNWNTSKVTAINSMFQNQVLFNQTMNTALATVNGVTYTAWDTLNVTNMTNVFGVSRATGIFNQNIANWNTSKVTTMNSMFSGQTLFDKNVGTKVVTVGASTYTAWDTLNVTTMAFMFNASITVGNFQGVFNNAGFSSFSSWNTSKVTTLQAIFQNQPLFKQNLRTNTTTVGASTYTSWDVLNVTNMRYLFYNNLSFSASQFNENISNWNTAKVTDMTAMLFNTVGFNQNLGSWNVSLVTAFDSNTTLADTFATNIGLSTINYDALLNGWATRPVIPNLVINFGAVKYSISATASRAILKSAPNNWTIIDGGLL